jgi:hypothetical protein
LEPEHEKKNQQIGPKMEPPTKNSGNKKIGGRKKGTVELGKIFCYDNGKTVDICKSHGGKQIY